MALLFVLALLFAWPTYGLSVVGWLVLSFFKAGQKVAKIDERQNRKVFLEPLFGERFSDFFVALDLPHAPGRLISVSNAHQCGRHIMNYIAHNPEEASLFMQGLNRWRTKGDTRPCHPVTAAEDERRFNRKGEIHLVAYRAIEAIMRNNPNLLCFASLELLDVMEKRLSLELSHPEVIFGNTMRHDTVSV